MDIRRLLTYTDNCRQVLQATLDARPDVFDTPFETTAEYRSIRELVAHCIGAEQRWVEQRLRGEVATARYEAQSAGTIHGIFADWAHVRARTRAALEDIHSVSHGSTLHTEIAFTLPQWHSTDILTVEEVYFHIFNHQIYHLGQISMALQQFGVDPPNFDYVFLHRDSDEDE